MKLAFSSNAFRKYSIEETIGIVAGIGYDGIEIMCDTPHCWPPDLTPQKIVSIKNNISKHKLGISNLNAFMMCAIGDFHHPSWIEEDEAYRQKRIDHTADCVRLANSMGVKNISTEPGGHIGSMNRSDALSLFRKGILSVAGEAERLGVKILVEPEPELLIENSEQFIEFISGIDSPAVGLNFDIGHFYCVGEDPADLIRKFGNRISHFHLEDISSNMKHFHLPPGEGNIDFASVFNAMSEIGYEGWVTIELYPFQEDAPEVAKRAFDFVKRYVK